MSYAFTFPGQGSQVVGMGRDLAEAFTSARAVFQEVDDVLGEKLSVIMWNGPEDVLTLTQNAQPALMASSLAVMAALKQEYGDRAIAPTFVAGHSLGEYSALATAEVFTLADTTRLLRLRGLAMQEAVPAGEGAMLALLGIDSDPAEKLCAAASQGDVCQVANDNAPGQIVISGAKTAIDRATALSSEYGVRRAIPLSVSAPFHCALMQPAAARMADALASMAMQAPTCPLVTNVMATSTSDPHVIQELLVRQITGVVRWRESVAYMADQGVETIFEVGTGRVLTGLARRIAPKLDARSISTVDDIRSFGAWLQGRTAA